MQSAPPYPHQRGQGAAGLTALVMGSMGLKPLEAPGYFEIVCIQNGAHLFHCLLIIRMYTKQTTKVTIWHFLSHWLTNSRQNWLFFFFFEGDGTPGLTGFNWNLNRRQTVGVSRALERPFHHRQSCPTGNHFLNLTRTYARKALQKISFQKVRPHVCNVSNHMHLTYTRAHANTKLVTLSTLHAVDD